MKQFYILANPKYYKKTMGWDLQDKEVRYTDDKLVLFIASEYVPDTNPIKPYACGWRDTDILVSYEPYLYCIGRHNIKDQDNTSGTDEAAEQE